MSSHKNLKSSGEHLLTPEDLNRRTGIVFICISVLVHGLFFGALIFFQDFQLPRPMPPVIQIDLVSFSPEPALEEPGKNEDSSKEEGVPVAAPEAPEVKKESLEIPTIKPDISLKTKPKNLKDLIAQQEKKKEEPEKNKEKPIEKQKVIKPVDSEKKVEEGKEKIEKNSEGQGQDKIAEALSRLQKKVQEQGKSKEGDGKGSHTGAGKKGYKPIDLYNLVIGSTIEQNWVFNETLASLDQNLQVIILIKILKSGEIRDIIYETRSGNRYLDDSAKKAVMKINPLPPLPPGMHSYDLGLIFTPKGLK